MLIDKRIDKNNWCEIKDILPQITEIQSLDLINMSLTEFPKMSHIIINDYFYCWGNQITRFKNCPKINGNFYCNNNQITSFKDCPIVKESIYCFYNKITSFKDCPQINGILYSDFKIFDNVQQYSKEKKRKFLYWKHK